MYCRSTKFLLINVTLIVLVVSGCAGLGDIFSSNKSYSIVLYVAHNNRGLSDSLNIVFIVDRDTIVNQNVSSSVNAMGSNRIVTSSATKTSTFNFDVREGRHQIVVESKNGGAGLDIIFTVDKPLWLFLDYWGKNHFQLDLSERPILFL